jgi:hypothetical protein
MTSTSPPGFEHYDVIRRLSAPEQKLLLALLTNPDVWLDQ